MLVALSTLAGPTADSALLVDVVVKALELSAVVVTLSTLAGPTADSALLVDVVVKALELPAVVVTLSALAGPTADSALLIDVVVKALELPKVLVALSTLAGPTADSALLVDVVVKALELPAVAVWVLPSLGVVAFKTTFGLAVSFSVAVVSLAVSAACGRAVSSAIAVCKPAYIANVELIKTEATPTVNFLIAKCCCFASSFCA